MMSQELQELIENNNVLFEHTTGTGILGINTLPPVAVFAMACLITVIGANAFGEITLEICNAILDSLNTLNYVIIESVSVGVIAAKLTPVAKIIFEAHINIALLSIHTSYFPGFPTIDYVSSIDWQYLNLDQVRDLIVAKTVAREPGMIPAFYFRDLFDYNILDTYWVRVWPSNQLFFELPDPDWYNLIDQAKANWVAHELEASNWAFSQHIHRGYDILPFLYWGP